MKWYDWKERQWMNTMKSGRSRKGEKKEEEKCGDAHRGVVITHKAATLYGDFSLGDTCRRALTRRCWLVPPTGNSRCHCAVNQLLFCSFFFALLLGSGHRVIVSVSKYVKWSPVDCRRFIQCRNFVHMDRTGRCCWLETVAIQQRREKRSRNNKNTASKSTRAN